MIDVDFFGELSIILKFKSATNKFSGPAAGNLLDEYPSLNQDYILSIKNS